MGWVLMLMWVTSPNELTDHAVLPVTFDSLEACETAGREAARKVYAGTKFATFVCSGPGKLSTKI